MTRKTSILLITAILIIMACIIIGFCLHKSRSSASAGQGNGGNPKISENNSFVNKKTDPIDALLPAIRQHDCIIKHRYYTLCYNEQNEQADWVAYKLTRDMLTSETKRKNNFRTDDMVKTASASPADYTKSGYDKGHLCPAADMSFSVDAMSETFFMSNMSPQTPQFNRGIWKTLEEKVREWALANNELWITTGPVVREGGAHIGKNKVAVPQYYYKVILDYKQPDIKGIGFIMKNQGSDKGIGAFAVSIDSVEKFTGIDFYTALPDKEEQTIEKEYDYKKW